MIVISEQDRRQITSGDQITVEERGVITITATRLAVERSMPLLPREWPVS
jgi:hypothetical protein